MRWPIRYQILLPFAGAMLVVVASVTLLDAHLAAGHSEAVVTQRLRDVVRTLLDSSFPLTDAVLRQMSGLSGAEYVLSDREGHAVAASRPLPGKLPVPERLAARWEDVELGAPVVLGPQQFFFTAVEIPARRGRSESLVLNILYPQDTLAQFRRAAAYPHLIVGAAALALVALLSLLISERMCRPLLQASAQVARLAEGDFHLLPTTHRNDELGDLVSSVNRLASQLDEMRAAIRRSERLMVLGRLSGGMAHTLRNQATGARLAVQLHQRHCAGTDTESLEVALRQLQLTEDHLRRFLAAGQPQEPRHVACDLDGLIADVASLVTPSCRHRRVALEVVPCTSPDPTLSADPDQLRQALMNLLLNGMEAAGPGGWVRIEHERTERAALVRVSDSGPGPAPEITARLFEPFVTSKPEGVGLGLAVARRLAEGHGGRLDYLRRHGATCFELSLPATAPPPDGAERGGADAVAADHGISMT